MASFNLSRAIASLSEGKALGLHPAFVGRDPVSTYSPGAARQDSVISQREANRHMDAYGGRQAIDWVFDCVNLYSDSVAMAEWTLRKPDGTPLVKQKSKGAPPDYEVGPADLYELLKKPNPYQLYDEVMALLVTDLLLVGNAYWLKWRVGETSGKPLALYRLSPAYVQIVPGAFGPKEYKYQPPGAKDPLKIALEELIHFRRPNPHSAYYGMGVIQGSGRSMDLELAITDTMASYYENRADPSMIVQSERRVPRDVFAKLRAQLRANAAGASNSGKLMLLESGLKASTLSVSAADAMFAELSLMSRDRIYGKFRASPLLFGHLQQSSSPSKVADVRSEFDNYTLRPFMRKLSDQVTAVLADLWGVEYVINHRSILPAEEAIKVGESVAKMPGVKVREVRRMYAQFGISESTGDAELDEQLLNEPLGDLGPDGQPLDPRVPSGPDKPLSGEAGRPPLPRNTSAIRKPEGKALPIAAIEARLTALGAGKAISTPAPDNSLPGEVAPADSFGKVRKTDIDGVSVTMAAGLRSAAVQLERDLLDHVEGKALKTSDLVGRIRKSAAWTTFKARVEEVLAQGARDAAQSGVMHSGVLPEDEIDYDGIVKSVVNRPEGVRGIVATLKKRVISRVKEARDTDAERTEYEAVVRATVSEWSVSQAATVADTEATHAYNEATLSAFEAVGDAEVYVTDGEDDDQPCIDANGSVWTIEEARKNRIEHPRCRRAFLRVDPVV